MTATRLPRALALAAAGALALVLSLAVAPAARAADVSIAADETALAAAIIAANNDPADDTIRIAAGSITLTGALPTITDDLEIIGAGSGELSIDGNGFGGFAATGTAVGIAGVTVSGATTGIGGFAASFALDDVVVTGADVGLTASGGDVTITDSSFHGNTSLGAVIQPTAGEQITITDSNFNDNGDGGLLVIALGTAAVSIDDSEFSRNTNAGAANGLMIQAFGGASHLIELAGVVADDNGASGVYVAAVNSDVTVADTLTRGNAAAGIAVQGGLTTFSVSESTSSGNGGLSANGAGIRFSGVDIDLTVARSTISGNTGVAGSGVVGSFTGGTLTVVNSTISGNTATDAQGPGGAVFAQGAGSVEIAHSTIVDNIGAATIAGVRTGAETDLSVTHSIIFGHGPGVDLDPQKGVAIGYSLVGTANADGMTALSAVDGNRVGIDPQLLPLGDNGGPTATHLPAEGSPVVNAGDPAVADPPQTDQRGGGFVRIAETAIDIGAVEAQAPVDPELAVTGNSVGRELAAIAGGLVAGGGLFLLVVAGRTARSGSRSSSAAG